MFKSWFKRKKSVAAAEAPVFQKLHAAGGGVLVSSQPSENVGQRWCHWPWRAMVLNSDGDVVCGCADPYKTRPLGNVAEQTMMEIWRGDGFRELRRGVNEGDLTACGECPLWEARPSPSPAPGPLLPEQGPTRLFVEPSIACNISCHLAVCNQENGIVDSRKVKLLDVGMFRKAIDELGPGLKRLEFYNYGESFVHPQSYDMISYARRVQPHLFIYASSNGLLFDRLSRREKLVQCGLDEIVFSIDGARPESYSRYRVKGDFNKVIDNLAACIELRNQLGLARPQFIWRYILFRWNDSAEEMKEALSLAGELGVDRFYWEITDHPKGCPSERYVPGTDDFKSIRHQVWGYSHLGMRAELQIVEQPGEVRPGQPFHLQVRAKNAGYDPWEQDHPLQKEFVRIGVQLLTADGRMLHRDWSRHFLPGRVRSGESVRMRLDLQSPRTAGAYVLRVDAVLEGVTWFEDVGSSPVEVPLFVPQVC